MRPTQAARLRAPTEFFLLNPPGNGVSQLARVGYRRDVAWLHRGHDSIRCDPSDGSITHDVDPLSAEAEVVRVRSMLECGPSGQTPLCAAVRRVVDVVRRRAADLRARGRKACVVIASDGAATDGDVAAAMAPLRDLPAWVVVRLCTDEEKVVDYWNRVDEDLELDMDVLDDLAGEAAEVCDLNPWLTYPLSLHRVREFGSCEKIFDLLDERELTLVEAKQFAGLLLGDAVANAPHPEVDYAGFLRALRAVLAAEPCVWCPRRKRPAPWIEHRKLRRLLKRKPLLAGARRGSGSAACCVS